jgi:diguanylate cyclase (GGDEF)-like protein
MRAALIVFLLSGALIVAVVFTLDRNAHRSSHQQAATELAGIARVSASTFASMRANLRTHVGELASSPALQRAVLAKSPARLRAFASAHHARIVLGGGAYGTLAGKPRISATATIASSGRVLARVSVAVPMDRSLLEVLERATPMPAHAALILVRGGHVLAGGPAGAPATLSRGRLEFGSVSFAGKAAQLDVPGTSVLAVEPMSAVEARANTYRSRLLFAATLTLALAAGLAVRLGRPVAHLLGDFALLRRHAETDGLTNLANRRTFDERLDLELHHARRLGTGVALVIADIDNFKSINDRYGHQTGDAVLRAVAAVFTDAARELDLPGRFGGEEIAVVLPGSQLVGARRFAERVRKGIEDLRVTNRDGDFVAVTASFGAACFPAHGTAEALVAAADDSLYEAKRGGKNRVVTAIAKKKARTRVPDRAVEAAT